ncbi:ribosome recycling factor, partial [Hypoxylon sp. FL1284]
MRGTGTRALWQQGLALTELQRAHHALSRPAFVAATTAAATAYTSNPRSATLPLRPRRPDLSISQTSFHTSARRYKKQKEAAKGGKGGKAAPAAAANDDGDGDGGAKHPQPNPEEPLDFADVASRLSRHDEHFRDALKKLRSGGRFNPDVIGALRVADPEQRKTGAATAGVTYPLREVAQIVPRGGRTVSILANEAAWVRPIMSAVQASADFNQQPQRDADNELELTLRVEPERRDDLARRARATCHEWRDRVRAARQRRDKLHATWTRGKLLGPDLKRTADKELDKLVKAKMTEIDAAEKDAVKAAET